LDESLGIGKLSVWGSYTCTHAYTLMHSYVTHLAAQQCVVIQYCMLVPLCACANTPLVNSGMQNLQGGSVIAEGRAGNPAVALCSLVRVHVRHRQVPA